MKDERYIISDAAKKLAVEPHVLRYWEEELELNIHRNEMGHRFYTHEDMLTFEGIKYLKEYGFHLRAIKFLLPDLNHIRNLSRKELMDLKYELEYKTTSPVITSPRTSTGLSTDTKMDQFKEILTGIISDALEGSEKNITKSVTENVSKEMDYMFRQKEEADEIRYRTLDETIRSFQQARKESATSLTHSESPKKRQKSSFFSPKKLLHFN